MTRRDLALVVTLCGAVGGAAAVVLVLREASGGGESVAPSNVAARASPGAAETSALATPAAADGAVAQTEAPASSDPAAADLHAVRALDGAEEVEFPGLIELSQLPGEATPIDGTLVLKNADPAAPPLRLEIPFHQSRFRGRGPGNAVVVVDKLVVGDREAVAKDERYALATRWIHIQATLATPLLLHVLDAASGRDLTGLTLRPNLHDEVGMTLLRGTASSGWYSLVRAKRTPAPAVGFDSPLELASFGWSGGGRNGIAPADGAADAVFVHAPGYGDDYLEVGEEQKDGTLRLRPAATLRVKVTPWPPAHTDATRDAADAELYVTVARRVEPVDDARTATTGADPIPAGLPPQTAALAREAIARRTLRLRAADSPQCHVAPVEADGSAKFDDLCEGEWLAWTGARDASSLSNVLVNGRRFGRIGDPKAFASIDPVPLFLRAGGREELTLCTDAAGPPGIATLIVHAFDATSGAPVALELNEFEAVPLDDPASDARANAPGTWFNGGIVPFEMAADQNGKAARVVKPGAAVVHVNARGHPDFDPVDLIVELKEGPNEVAIQLPRAQGIVVSVDADKAFAQGGVNWFDATAIKLTRNGVEYEARTWWTHGRNEPSRRMHRFGPLDPGRYTLTVPHDAGFDREGEIEVEVRPHELTTVVLELRPTGAPRDKGR